MPLTRSLGTCQFILISLTGILIIGWILTNKNSQENSSKKQVLPPIFDTEHANKLQEFEWSVVQNNTSAPTTYSPK
jgi:hypothetical protein